jgi:antitoxin (DNA-binding transcriptional repressor) of toxin-antitoxin stability system
MQATFKQLRRQTGIVMQAVERGETIILTYRGKPVAEMCAVGKEPGEGNDTLFGIWEDNEAVTSVDDFVAKTRKGRVG